MAEQYSAAHSVVTPAHAPDDQHPQAHRNASVSEAGPSPYRTETPECSLHLHVMSGPIRLRTSVSEKA